MKRSPHMAIISTIVMAVSLMMAPTFASGKESPVVNFGVCYSRNAVAYDAKGIEFKCSVGGGGLKWKKTGGKQGAGSGTSTSTLDVTKYANVSGKIKIDG